MAKCIYDCGLEAAPGDVMCEGCCSGHERNPEAILELPPFADDPDPDPEQDDVLETVARGLEVQRCRKAVYIPDGILAPEWAASKAGTRSSRVNGEWVTVPLFWYVRCGECPECKFEAVMAGKSVRGMPVGLTRTMIARWKEGE